ncbi:TolC family protein [soil metagenome]
MVKPYQWRRYAVLLTASILMSLNISAYAAGPTLTLNDAILLSLRYNPNVQSAEFKRITDKFSLRISQYNFEWQYAMTGAANVSRTATQGVVTWGRSANLTNSASINTAVGSTVTATFSNPVDGPSYTPNVNIGVTQHLVKGFGSAVTLAPLFDAYDADKVSKLALKQVVMDNIDTVIQAYRSYVSAQANFKIQLQSLKRAEETVKNTEIQIKAGNTAPAEKITAALNVAQLQLGLTQQENTVQTAREALLTSIGLEIITPIIVPIEIKTEKFQTPSREKSIELALRNDTGYLSALLGMEQQKRALLIARDNARWTVDLNANSTFTSDPTNHNHLGNLFNGRNMNQNVGVTLTVPLNHLPLEQSISNAETGIEQSKIALLNTRRAVITNVVNGIRNIEIARISIEQAEQQMQLATTNVHNAMLQFRYGRTSMFEYTSKQDELTTAEQNVLTAKIGYLNAISSYEKIVGVSLDRWGIKIRY